MYDNYSEDDNQDNTFNFEEEYLDEEEEHSKSNANNNFWEPPA